eukprot:1407835-Amphidinium_carterae.1
MDLVVVLVERVLVEGEVNMAGGAQNHSGARAAHRCPRETTKLGICVGLTCPIAGSKAATSTLKPRWP